MVCLHPFYVCDGNPQCPQKDDELLCGMSCPQHCVCHGLAFTCTQHFAAAVFPGMRYLDASGSGMTPGHLTNNRMLVHMDLSECRLSSVGLLKFPNLISLDLSNNVLTDINVGQLYQSRNLRLLILSSNPIQSLFARRQQKTLVLTSLEYLDISNVTVTELETDISKQFTKVRTINISFTRLERVTGSGFRVLKSLHTLDLRGCPVKSFSSDVFKGLNGLHTLFVDNYKLCCPYILPDDFNINHCHGPKDRVSSCESVIASALHRAPFIALTILGITSHCLSVVFWLFLAEGELKPRFYIFLVHMAGCDLLMGVHTAIVTIADQVYRGHYVRNDTAWRHSVMCQVSSFVFFLSADVSAFLACLMTLDRCAALRCPHKYVHVTSRATHTCCMIVWVGCVMMAAASLIPRASEGKLYSQTAVCQPLTSVLADPSNHEYTIAALVVLSLVLIFITSLGQLYVAKVILVEDDILKSLRFGRVVSSEFTLSRRVFTFVLFNILCWLWSCLFTLMATTGVYVPSTIQVATSLLALPLKSALNPSMMLIGHLQERQRQTQRKRLIQRLGNIRQH